MRRQCERVRIDRRSPRAHFRASFRWTDFRVGNVGRHAAAMSVPAWGDEVQRHLAASARLWAARGARLERRALGACACLCAAMWGSAARDVRARVRGEELRFWALDSGIEASRTRRVHATRRGASRCIANSRIVCVCMCDTPGPRPLQTRTIRQLLACRVTGMLLRRRAGTLVVLRGSRGAHW